MTENPDCAAETQPQAATPAEERAAVRRRLEADIEDAKKTLWNARSHFDRLCNELAELARAEREANR